MAILEKIEKNLRDARISKETDKISFWSTVLASIKLLEKSEKKKDINDANIVSVVQRLIKEAKETEEAAVKAGRTNIASKANMEISMLDNLIPDEFRPVGDNILAEAIEEIISSMDDSQKKRAMGIIMPALKKKFGNRFDGKTANAIAVKALKERP